MSTRPDLTPESTPPLPLPQTMMGKLKLAQAIDGQLDFWHSYTAHPSHRFQHGILARIISEERAAYSNHQHSEPQVTSLIVFGDRVSRLQYEKRLRKIGRWFSDEVLETIPPQNVGMGEYIQTVRSFADVEGAKPEYATASATLYHLFILREQLAADIGRAATLDLTLFRQLTTTIDGDLS